MNPEALRDAFWRAWAQVPSYAGGRLEVGPLIIMTRSELQALAWRHMKAGAEIEQEKPGVVVRAARSIDPKDQGVLVRHLHSV